MTVANVMALDVVVTAVAQVVLGIRVLGLKTNAGTAMFVMVMASALSVFRKLRDGRQSMHDMKKTTVSIVLQVATVDSVWGTDVGPVGRAEFARPVEDQAAVNFATKLR